MSGTTAAAAAPAFTLTVTGPNGASQTMTPAAFFAGLLADPETAALIASAREALPPARAIKVADGVVLVQDGALVQAPAANFVGFAEYLIGKKLGA